MQYQVYKEETGELVAWIDTKDAKAVTLSGYAVKCGEDLMCIENNIDVTIGVFEKVSDEQYYLACLDKDIIKTIPSLGVVGSDYYYGLIELPRRKTHGSAGYDFFIPYDLTIRAGETVKIPTGVKVRMADGYVLMMYPRSSLGFKYQMTMDNTVCVIDNDYYNNEDNEGHIFVKMTNHSDKDCVLKAGQAYCQGIFNKFYVTDNDHLTEKQTRVGGCGSTDK